jgi:hypothetical protein
MRKMPGRKRIFALWCALGIAVGAGAIPTIARGAADDSGGVKRALLIGINKYKAVPSLQGSVNDVETMRSVLMTHWGFLPRNITMLTDENATHDKIMAALNDLVAVSTPLDTVYFHYSGHGSQVQDLNGDEEDGLDETIVPQDGRSGGVRDIVDDELDVIFSKLRARSAMIVLDSCHSGTATRSFDIRARSVPQDMRIDLYRTGVPGTTTRGITPLPHSRFIVMGGAADNEEALDGPVEGSYHGFFTYALARSLTAASNDASPREIMAAVTRELGRIQTTFGRTSMPEPQLEGPPEDIDAPLFASRKAAGPASAGAAAAAPQNPRLAWLDTAPAAAGQITLLNGLLLGATPGSTWAIYPPGETLFSVGHARAVATVTQVTGKDARATLSGDSGTIEPKSRAVALLPGPAAAHVAIRLVDVPNSERGRVEGVLKRHIKNIALVGPDQAARFLVDMQGQTVRLLTADGLGVVGSFAINDENSAADVARVASRSAKAAELLSLDNPSSQLRVSVRLAGSQPIAGRDIQLVANTAPAQLHSRHPGEPRSTQNSLQLIIDVNANAYLTIVDVDSDGTMNVLFPNDYQHSDFYTNGAVHAGEAVMIPDSLLTGNRAGFYWDYSPPRGIDTVRVFASTDLATADTIRQRIKALQKAADQNRNSLTRGIGEDLDGLRADLGKLATRGITVVADQGNGNSNFSAPAGPSDWSATSVTIQVAN